jgi:hypothetical protein
MKKQIRNFVKRTLFNSQRIIGGERQSILLGEIRAEQIRLQARLPHLAAAEFSVFSQWGEDGILSWIIDVIQPKFENFVEFGVEDFREANCRYLLMSRNWSGLIIDGSQNNIDAVRQDAISYKHDLKTTCSFITKENIASLLSNAGYAGSLGILSVDIDGVDYWVLEQIKNHCDIVVVEYNDVFGPQPLSVPYDPAFVRLNKHWSGMYWGASLSAFQHLLEGRGYTFIGTNSVGTNAFFVAKQHSSKIKKCLTEIKAWPCKMREARLKDGSLAFKTYNEMRNEISDLPVVNVKTNKTLTLGEAMVERA